MLNLFLALLLSSFAGLNDSDEEDEEAPKPTRLQRLIEWSKKFKEKRMIKKKNKENGGNNTMVINGDDEKKDCLVDGGGVGGEDGDKDMVDGRTTISDTNNPESMVRSLFKVIFLRSKKTSCAGADPEYSLSLIHI